MLNIDFPYNLINFGLFLIFDSRNADRNFVLIILFLPAILFILSLGASIKVIQQFRFSLNLLIFHLGLKLGYAIIGVDSVQLFILT